jgi:hypothetical protein
MLRFVKHFGWLAVMVFSLRSAFGFALLGPTGNGGDAWQTAEIGYGTGGEIGSPKNLGEEFRWNTPFIYYAFDQNFLDYFGSNGVAAVEQAIAILNGLTNFSKYSADLSEVPLSTRRVNYAAQALHLFDLKSTTLHLTLEELGLARPDQFAWTLRARRTQPGRSCPFMIYDVIMRNFDPVTSQPTGYINGDLWTYFVWEICSGGPPVAWTGVFPVDPLAPVHYPVMSLSSLLTYGLYTTALTRDDVAGLRYLYSTNNVNWESMSSGSTLFYTNIAAGQQLLYTSNLTMFANQALTNNAAALQNLYPNLNIASTTNIYTNIYLTNITAYFTNYPMEPYGSPAHLVLVTNLTLTVQTWYHHTFNNLTSLEFTNGVWTAVPLPDITFHTNLSLQTVQTTIVTNSPMSIYGSPLKTNTTTITYLTNGIAGEYVILPTNMCDIALSALQATLVTITTNVVVSATNGPPGFTNTQSFTELVIDYFTNHVFTYYQVECPGTNTMLRKGMDKFTFLRANYDSLVGRFFQPITNEYYLVDVTNSMPVVQKFRRILRQPDYLYTAQDLLGTLALRTVTAGNYNDANRNTGLAGPGNIEPNMTITFNKVGPILRNLYDTNFLVSSGLSQMESTTNFIWGSYDGSTNDPVIYPSGTSIDNLEAQILFQIVTASLPDGKVGVSYPGTQLQAAGGVLPYTAWTWSSGWPSLPPGLSLSPSGQLTGIPIVPGTYGFTVSVRGGDARTITRSLSININP